MVTTLIILAVIAAILLTIVILIQNPKGGGLSSEFGGGGTSQMFGVQRTGDIISKLTWGFFTFIVVVSLGILIINKVDVNKQLKSNDVNVEKATSAPEIPSLPSTVPATGDQNAPTTAPATPEQGK